MGLFTVAMGALGVMQAGQSVASGIAAKGEAKYNAGLYEQQAGMIANQQNLQEYQYNRQIGQVMGKSMARTAKSGLDLSGSPMAVMVDTQTQMELDKNIANYNLEVQKRQALSIADRYRKQGKLAMQQGYMNAFTTLLQTGASMAARGGSSTSSSSGFDMPAYKPMGSLTDAFKNQNMYAFGAR